MTPTAVFDLDKVLLSGDASTRFLRGRLRQAPARPLPLLLGAPALLAGTAIPQLRPLAARAMTRLAVGGRSVPTRRRPSRRPTGARWHTSRELP